MENFLDLRTLAVNNLLTGFVFGISLFFYARINENLKGIRELGLGFLLLSIGFLLIGIRHYVPDWISVIFANLLVGYGFYYQGLGALKFLNLSKTRFNRVSLFLGGLLFASFIYFTYFSQNINARVFCISLFVTILSFLLFLATRPLKMQRGQVLLSVLKATYLLMAIIFLLRSLFSVVQLPINDFMHAGIWHGFSFMGFELMFIVIGLTTTGIANVRLSEDLETQATIDPLTGLYNRRSLNRQALLDLERCKRDGRTFSVMIIDIDFFKSINDSYGHQAGDKVLVEFSGWLKSEIRSSDFAARFGGEEFVVLFNGIDNGLLTKIANQMNCRLAEKLFEVAPSKTVNMTISIGIACSEKSGLDWEQLLSLADKRLYKAKQQGRNQVVFG